MEQEKGTIVALKFYEYAQCDTCRKARKFLTENDVAFEAIPIVDQPPTMAELKRMLRFIESRGGGLKNLFNTSGEVYRSLKVGSLLAEGMSEREALEMLAAHGKLIKRPFVLSADGGSVGFQAPLFSELYVD